MKSPCSYFPVYKCNKSDISMEKIPFRSRHLLFLPSFSLIHWQFTTLASTREDKAFGVRISDHL